MPALLYLIGALVVAGVAAYFLGKRYVERHENSVDLELRNDKVSIVRMGLYGSLVWLAKQVFPGGALKADEHAERVLRDKANGGRSSK